MSTELAARMAALKLRDKQFPVEAIIAFFLDCRKECYIDYYKGTKLLINWLSPIAPLAKRYPPVPDILTLNYTISELAKYLAEATCNTRQELEAAIIHIAYSHIGNTQ